MTKKDTSLEERANAALEEICDGGRISDVCRRHDILATHFYKFFMRAENFERYCAAREVRALHRTEELEDREQQMIDGVITAAQYYQIKDRIKWQNGQESRRLFSVANQNLVIDGDKFKGLADLLERIDDHAEMTRSVAKREREEKRAQDDAKQHLH